MPKPLWTLSAEEMNRQIDGRKDRLKASVKAHKERRRELEKLFPNLREGRDR